MKTKFSKGIILDGQKGFLGKNIFSHLLKNNYSIIGLDRCSNLDIEFTSKKILIIATGLFEGSRIDLVESNILRPLQVINKLNNIIERIILLSSGAVYGSKVNSPRSMENDDLIPYDTYSITKISIENLISQYCSELSIPLTILRLPIVYSGSNNKGVIPMMLNSYHKNKYIKVYSSGNPIRDFLHIDDLLTAIEEIIQLEIYGKYNISSRATYSMLELANIIVKKESEIIISEESPNLLEKLSLNCEKAKNHFSYTPKINSLNAFDLFEMYGIKL